MGRDRTIYTLGLLLAILLLLASRGVERISLPVSAPVRVESPAVALTFDDGPLAQTTGTLLDELKKRGAHATFFLIGSQLEGNEGLVERMADEGHQVGVHTWDHAGLTGLSEGDFYRQVGRMEEALEGLTGQESYAIRPPYGYVDATVQRRAGAPIYLWSIDPEDWKYRDTQRVVDHVVSRAKDGDVILLHDIYPTSVRAAAQIVDALQARGFQFLTLDELARRRGVEPEPGEVYRNFYP